MLKYKDHLKKIEELIVTGELLIYALVAGGLVFWLRSILGTRHGEERDRSDNIISLDGEPLSQDKPAANDPAMTVYEIHMG